MSMKRQDLLTEKEAAKILKMSSRTLQRWRQERTGPDFVKLGARAVRYKRSTVEAFVDELEEELRKSSADGL